MTTRAQRVQAALTQEALRISAVKKRKEPGQRKTLQGVVHNPLGHDTNVVVKIYDSIVAMHKRGQINAAQYEAAEKLRIAHDVVYGQAGNAMDFDRSRGGGSPGRMPAQPYMVACETLRIAKFQLFPRDYAVVYRVCIQGIRIADCGHLFKAGREGQLEAGKALRRGLSQLADHWGLSNKGRKGKPSYFRNDKSQAGDNPLVERGNAFVMS